MSDSNYTNVLAATDLADEDSRATVNRPDAGKQRSSLNALRHGLTKHVIDLPAKDHAA
jgi:hypothetical protein